MNAQDNRIKEPISHIDQIRNVIDRLKTQAKEKYNKDLALGDDVNFDHSYIRGYYFGQMASLEDCYHLMLVLVEGLTSKNELGNSNDGR